MYDYHVMSSHNVFDYKPLTRTHAHIILIHLYLLLYFVSIIRFIQMRMTCFLELMHLIIHLEMVQRFYFMISIKVLCFISYWHIHLFLIYFVDTLQAFVSEYAVTGKDAGTGSLLAALAEAGFLIGLEKNRFILIMKFSLSILSRARFEILHFCPNHICKRFFILYGQVTLLSSN